MSTFSQMHEDYLDPDRFNVWDEECEMCGVDPADCECPECPNCGEQGNPVCYAEAGIFGGCHNDFAYRLLQNKRWNRSVAIREEQE